MSDVFALIMIHIFSEVSDLDTGLLLEVWEKGMLWDKAIGYYWCPLNTIPFTKQVRTSVFFTFTKYRDVGRLDCISSSQGSTSRIKFHILGLPLILHYKEFCVGLLRRNILVQLLKQKAIERKVQQIISNIYCLSKC